MKKQAQTFRSNTSAAVAIEFALILPVLLLFIVGIIDFGHWFFLEQIAQRTTSNAAVAIQRDQTQTYGQVNAAAGLGVVNMGAGANFICALSAQDAPSAESAAYGCGGNAWNIGNPNADPSTPYYVGVSSHIRYTPLIPLSATWPPRDIFARTMVRVNPGSNVPTCGANQYLTGDGTKFICRNFTVSQGNTIDVDNCHIVESPTGSMYGNNSTCPGGEAAIAGGGYTNINASIPGCNSPATLGFLHFVAPLDQTLTTWGSDGYGSEVGGGDVCTITRVVCCPKIKVLLPN